MKQILWLIFLLVFTVGGGAQPPSTTRYPTEIDNTTTLPEARAQATLQGAITATATSLVLTDATTFPMAGAITINDEVIHYTGKRGNTLTGLLRGRETTVAKAQPTGALVRLQRTSHNALQEAVIALQRKLGKGTSTPTADSLPVANADGSTQWKHYSQLPPFQATVIGVTNPTATKLPLRSPSGFADSSITETAAKLSLAKPVEIPTLDAVQAVTSPNNTLYFRADGNRSLHINRNGTSVDIGGELFNVKNFGAKGDVRGITVAMTNGSLTVAASSSVFTPSDTGKFMVVYGAGASGAALNGTITYTSATTATLSVQATTTVTGAMAFFGTDDTAAFQACEAAAASANGTRFVPTGGYFVGNMVLPPEARWRGEGRNSSILYARPGLSGKWWTDRGNAAKTFLRDLQFHGTKQARLTHGIELGSGTQFGTEGLLDNLWLRDLPNATALHVNGNVGLIQNISVLSAYNGIKLLGEANLAYNLLIADVPRGGIGFFSSGHHNYGVVIEAFASQSLPVLLYRDATIYGLTLSPVPGATLDHWIEIDPVVATWNIFGFHLFANKATVTQGLFRYTGGAHFGGTMAAGVVTGNFAGNWTSGALLTPKAGTQFSSVPFTNLGTSANGYQVYCADCTKTTPCTAGGAGAFAKRINNAWDCN